jgi:hypothetical protein
MTNYQKRMKTFIWTANVYWVAAFVLIVTEPISFLAWLILGSTITLLIALALGFDAVYDSLTERPDRT